MPNLRQYLYVGSFSLLMGLFVTVYGTISNHSELGVLGSAFLLIGMMTVNYGRAILDLSERVERLEANSATPSKDPAA